jgi:hypothetical protein
MLRKLPNEQQVLLYGNLIGESTWDNAQNFFINYFALPAHQPTEGRSIAKQYRQ